MRLGWKLTPSQSNSEVSAALFWVSRIFLLLQRCRIILKQRGLKLEMIVVISTSWEVRQKKQEFCAVYVTDGLVRNIKRIRRLFVLNVQQRLQIHLNT